MDHKLPVTQKPKTWEEFVEKHRHVFEQIAKATAHKKKDQYN